MEDNKVLSETQYGLRKNLSAGDAIETFTDLITKGLDSGKKSLAILIGPQKAFLLIIKSYLKVLQKLVC